VLLLLLPSWASASSSFTQPGWLGPAQPMWGELSPAQKNKKVEK